MRKSYVSETTLKVQVEIDLGEIENLISSLSDLDTADGKNYRAKELVTKLQKLQQIEAAQMLTMVGKSIRITGLEEYYTEPGSSETR